MTSHTLIVHCSGRVTTHSSTLHRHPASRFHVGVSRSRQTGELFARDTVRRCDIHGLSLVISCRRFARFSTGVNGFGLTGKCTGTVTELTVGFASPTFCGDVGELAVLSFRAAAYSTSSLEGVLGLKLTCTSRADRGSWKGSSCVAAVGVP